MPGRSRREGKNCYPQPVHYLLICGPGICLRQFCQAIHPEFLPFRIERLDDSVCEQDDMITGLQLDSRRFMMSHGHRPQDHSSDIYVYQEPHQQTAREAMGRRSADLDLMSAIYRNRMRNKMFPAAERILGKAAKL